MKLQKLILFTAVCLAALACAGCKKELGQSPLVLLQSAVLSADTDWNKALEYAEAAYRKEPEDTSIQIVYALALDNTARTEEALKIAAIAAGNTQSFMAQYLYGRLLFRAGNYTNALIYLKNAYELNKTDVNNLLLLERTSAILDHDDTMIYLQALLKIHKNSKNKLLLAYLYNEFGIYCTLRKDLKSKRNVSYAQYAQGMFAEAAKFDPKSPEICLNQAIVEDYFYSPGKTVKMSRGRTKTVYDKKEAIRLYQKFLTMIQDRQYGYEKERVAVELRLGEIH